MLSFLSALLGLAAGSFVNALVWRVHKGERMTGRSRCRDCETTIFKRDLIPIASFFLLRRRCRNCKKSISWQYPLVEAATAAAFVGIALVRGGSPFSLIAAEWIVATLLVALFVSDVLYGTLPDGITLPALAVVVLARFAGSSEPLVEFADLFAGLLIGGGFFLGQWVVSQGRWIGDGDIRLGMLMGAILGIPGILLALVLSYTIGAMVAIGLVASGKKTRKSTIALGPFLIIGTIITYYSNDSLVWLLGY